MILAVYREPFAIAPHVQRLPEGGTLADMRARMRGLPPEFDERGVICINGHVVPPALWGMVRPKPITVTEVTFHCPPAGGGGGKNTLAMVASIALTVGASAIASGGIAALGLAGGSVGAAAAASATLLVGNLALSALSAPPVSTLSGRSSRSLGESSATGNVLEPNVAIPRVVGERRVFPPFVSEPFTYFDGDDEVVEAVYGLAGPHRLQGARIGGVKINTLENVQSEAREGWDDDALLTLISRQSRTDTLNSELRGFVTKSDDGQALETEDTTIAASLPVAQVVTTRESPDEHQLQIVFPSGVHRNGDSGDEIRIPFRIRIRPEGETAWRLMPEIHWRAGSLRAMRATIRLQWRTPPGSVRASKGTGWAEARLTTPDQAAAPTRDGWSANEHFRDNAAGTQPWLVWDNVGTSRVVNVSMSRYTCTFYLFGSDFPKGRYEVEIVRGAAFREEEYNSEGYILAGAVKDMFWYSNASDPKIAANREGMADAVSLVRSVSIWNDPPVPLKSGLALIACRARNRQLGQVSVNAGGYVQDWNGTAWADWVVTKNPAPHLRDIYRGNLNANAISDDMISDDMMLGFRAHCAAKGYEVNALIDGNSMTEAAQIVAACGYGRPYASEVWGVIWDRDRSGDAPVQIFTPRNSRGFSWERSFPIMPEGFLVTFADEGRDYADRQVTVLRAGAPVVTRLLEQVTYQGIVTLEAARARAQFDLAQSQQRAVTYTFDAPAEAIVCRRGSLIGVQHYSLDAASASGRIVGRDGNTLTLDEVVPGGNARAIAVRSGGAVTVAAITNGGQSSTVTMSDAIDADEGDLFVVGPATSVLRRLIVMSIEPHADLTCTITAVDEAPALFT